MSRHAFVFFAARAMLRVRVFIVRRRRLEGPKGLYRISGGNRRPQATEITVRNRRNRNAKTSVCGI